ncbi:hypothetical protein EPA93_41070 [Ktedonosporobacter rubrisoli]|uniref:Bacterial spore germination immunoglobulin-like domain-containing protein n=1 Tax=Ktedonosporobacter rubrisoli TaxID=2509675 RepID=A0A4P6K2F5_KTERU|nr:hypothetical protein [Ktedonosporobacter rubrisoli]QBD82033.1 hypothetical protein EPA93_41070 [Ktedonosporobacter rubrisoli]
MKLQPEAPQRPGKRTWPLQRSLLLCISWTMLFCGLPIILGACLPGSKPAGGNGGGNQALPTMASDTPTPAASPTATPKPITLQTTGCPADLNINWDNLVGAQANVSKVQKVICGSLQGSGSVNALIDLRYYSADSRLDFFVYKDLSNNPTKLFTVQGLHNGDAQISPTGTIITAEVGAKDNGQNTPDIFKEYQWMPDNGNFEQVLFPGIYPDVTHYQAEQSQSQLNSSITTGSSRENWRKTFFGVPTMMAKTLFHWSTATITTKTVSYRTATGSYAVAVTNTGPGGGGFIAYMFRLDSNQESNIFEVMKITTLDDATMLSNPATGLQVINPAKIEGTASVSSGVVGRVVIYTDTYSSVGDSGPINGTGSTSFSKAVNYQLNASGLQEGIVIFYSTNQNNMLIVNQVSMAKVLLTS